MDKTFEIKNPPSNLLRVVTFFLLFDFCCAQDFDWTETGDWTPKLTVHVETSKEGYGDFPFRDTVTIPGKITKISNHGESSLILVQLYSVSEPRRGYHMSAEELALEEKNKEFGFTNSNEELEIEQSDDVQEITVKLPFAVAQTLKVAKKDSYDWDYHKFLFDKNTKELNAIELEIIQNWSQIHNEDNLLTWVEDADQKRVDEDALPISERVSLPNAEPYYAESYVWAFRRVYRAELKRQYRFNGLRLSYFCKGIDDRVWLKEYYGDNERKDYQEINWINHMFWYTLEGVSVYIYSGESDTGADIMGSTTMVSSVSASEMFGKPKGGLVVYNEVRSIEAPNGYSVVEAANANAKVLKLVDEDSSVNVRAYRSIEGVRYYVSDSSYDRISEGITPNYIRIQP